MFGIEEKVWTDFSVSLRELMEEFNLKDITDCKRIDEIRITTSEVNRPGLQLVGYLEYFGSDRIQIIGQGEYEFMKTLGPEEIYRRMDAFFATGFPCLVVARDLDVCLSL